MKNAKTWLIISILIVVIGTPIRLILHGLDDILFIISIDAFAVGSNVINYLLEKSDEAQREKELESIQSIYEDIRSHKQNGA